MRIRLMLSHSSIVLMLLAFIAAIFYTIFAAETPYVWLFVPLGIALQYLNEYSIHRFIFHQPAPKSQWLFDLLYQAHYGHHDFPSKTALFFVPVWFALPNLVINLALIWCTFLIFGFENAHQYAIASTCIGGVGLFLCYEWFHMTAHVQASKTALERYTSRLHGRHHFSDYESVFHVSPGGILVDQAMGTDYDQEKVRSAGRVKFIRTLGLQPNDERLMNARRRFADRYGITDQEIAQAARVK